MARRVELGNFESAVGRLKSGRDNSKSEVLQEGVRLIDNGEKRLALIDAALARGIADADAGRTHGAEEVFSELKFKYALLSND